jgi:transposase
MAKRRGAPEKASVKKILNAISGTGGLISAIAVKLGVHYHTVLNYEKKYESIRLAIEEERDRILDKAESNLFMRIKEGDEETSKWFLARKGRHRGYSEKIDTKQKIEGTIETLIKVHYEEDKND